MPIGAGKLGWQKQAPASGYPAWQASHAYALGDKITEGGLNYECIRAGKSDLLAHKPTFPAGLGATVLDGVGCGVAAQTVANTSFNYSTRAQTILAADAVNAPGLVLCYQQRIGTIGAYYRISTDYGVTWSAEKDMSAQIPYLLGMLPLSTSVVLAAGLSSTPVGYMARSTDGGQNFTVVYTGGTAVGLPYSLDGTNIYAVQTEITYDEDGYPTGATASVLHSANAGVDWHIEKVCAFTPQSESFHIFKVTGSTNYWVVYPYGPGLSSVPANAGCQLSEDMATETALSMAAGRGHASFINLGGGHAVIVEQLGTGVARPAVTTNGGATWANKSVPLYDGAEALGPFMVLQPYSGGPTMTFGAAPTGAADMCLTRTWDEYVNNEPIEHCSDNASYTEGSQHAVYVGDGKMVFAGGCYLTSPYFLLGNYASLKWQRTA